jgi:hypothetical protein
VARPTRSILRGAPLSALELSFDRLNPLKYNHAMSDKQIERTHQFITDIRKTLRLFIWVVSAWCIFLIAAVVFGFPRR